MHRCVRQTGKPSAGPEDPVFSILLFYHDRNCILTGALSSHVLNKHCGWTPRLGSCPCRTLAWRLRGDNTEVVGVDEGWVGVLGGSELLHERVGVAVEL